MPALRSAALLCLFLFAACGPSGPRGSERPALGPDASARWTVRLDATGFAQAADAAAGPDRVAVVGSFAGRLSAGGQVADSDETDGFVAAMDASGAVLWLRSLRGPGLDRLTAVAVAPDGAVAVAGSFAGRAEVAGRAVAGSAGAAVVALLGPGGDLRWHRVIDADDHVAIRDLAITADGGVAAVGYFAGTVTSGDRSLTSAGAHDGLMIRLAADGEVRWSRRIGGSGADYVHGIASQGDRLLVAGGFARTADFLGAALVSNHNQDGFAGELDGAGGLRWVNTFGGSGRDTALAVAADADSVVVAGTFSGGDANFGTGELDAGEARAAFAAGYSATGEPRWSRRLGDGPAEAVSVARVRAGWIVAGSFSGEQRLAGAPRTARGARDLFVIEIDAAGQPRWSLTAGEADHDALAAIATLPGDVVVAGSDGGAVVSAYRSP